MFTSTQQSQATFTFAINPHISTAAPVVGSLIDVTCSVNLSIVAPPTVATTGGSGSVQLSSGGLITYSDIANVMAGSGRVGGIGPTPAEMIGPQSLGSSQATLVVTFDPASSVLQCAISIGASSLAMANIQPANGSLSLPLDTQAVEIVMTDWSFTQVWAPLGMQTYQLGATLAVTANGTTHTVNAG